MSTAFESGREPLRPPPAPLERTGVPQLDLVLGGGLPRGALVILQGPPGSGKTTLASQIVFAAATRGERALILTAFSEPTVKLLEHLRGFRFFTSSLVGMEVQVLSLQQFLLQGLETAEREIVAAARQFQARWVVLDGFQAFHTLAPDQGALRHVLYRLGTRLSLEGTTTLITTEAEPRDAELYPEMTTGDVLLGLYFELSGVRAERGLEVIKVRGHAPLPGRHRMAISAEGVTVFPRLETRIQLTTSGGEPPAATAGTTAPPGRASFGVADLDALLEGGLPRRTSTLLAGSLGAGKTLLALHFALEGVSHGEPTVFLSFRETQEDLLAQTESYTVGEQLRAALAGEGSLDFQRWEPVELDPDQVATELMRIIEQRGVRRLVIDSIDELANAVSESARPRRVRNYLAALRAALRVRGVTLLAIKETAQAVSATMDYSADVFSVLAENVLLVQQALDGDRLHRIFWMLKMRSSAREYLQRELVITSPEGVRLLPPGERLQGKLGSPTRRQDRRGRRTRASPSADGPQEESGA